MTKTRRALDYKKAISSSGLSIYDPIEVGDDLWIPAPELEELLNAGLRGFDLRGLPLRTRSKAVKGAVCNALGYPVPACFKKTRPRFVGQCFDTYAQKSNNLQVWNEELSPTRRYVLIRVSESDRVEKVKVVTGDALALLDTTGTLTQKYQARLTPGREPELISAADTHAVRAIIEHRAGRARLDASPISHPSIDSLLPICVVFDLLKTLIGIRFQDVGFDQERNRGAGLHRRVCRALGYEEYHDDGRFPDVRNQLIEVKLQTSPTIDLGLVLPSSTAPLDVPKVAGTQLRHCDVRYAVFYATIEAGQVQVRNLHLSTGADFFSRFDQFQGQVLNQKLQIPLPLDFFDT